ncbi:response regulator [Telluribacter sp.]|jgi:CheY-like chemotaxis protein|uniref:response regulator n=1 Tax=Telluribacter sp. TaxID=1978767 RepID=UPI002E0F498C|nr:response regulator [Telluribacter sp.]
MLTEIQKMNRVPQDLITILLVEDDEVDVMNVKRAFKKNNILNPLVTTNNGLEALKILRSNNQEVPMPRIILLDLNMPMMGGIEFLQELRKDPQLSSLSVFVMTTSNEDSDKIKAYNLNVAGYILKPLSLDSFIAAVSTLNSYWTLCEFPK